MPWITITETVSFIETVARPGWDAGARSMASFANDGRFTFTVGQATGIVCGLNTDDQSADYIEIQHGFFIEDTKYKIIEYGVLKTAIATYAKSNEFRIERIDGVVTYYVNDTLVYTSTQPSVGTVFLDCSLYANSDAIQMITMEELQSSEALAVSLSPLHAFVQVDDVLLLWGSLSPLIASGNADTQFLSGQLTSLVGRLTEGDQNVLIGSLSALIATGDSDELIPDYNQLLSHFNALTAYGVTKDPGRLAGSLSPMIGQATEGDTNLLWGSLSPLKVDTVLSARAYFVAAWADYQVTMTVRVKTARQRLWQTRYQQRRERCFTFGYSINTINTKIYQSRYRLLDYDPIQTTHQFGYTDELVKIWMGGYQASPIVYKNLDLTYEDQVRLSHLLTTIYQDHFVISKLLRMDYADSSANQLLTELNYADATTIQSLWDSRYADYLEIRTIIEYAYSDYTKHQSSIVLGYNDQSPIQFIFANDYADYPACQSLTKIGYADCLTYQSAMKIGYADCLTYQSLMQLRYDNQSVVNLLFATGYQSKPIIEYVFMDRYEDYTMNKLSMVLGYRDATNHQTVFTNGYQDYTNQQSLFAANYSDQAILNNLLRSHYADRISFNRLFTCEFEGIDLSTVHAVHYSLVDSCESIHRFGYQSEAENVRTIWDSGYSLNDDETVLLTGSCYIKLNHETIAVREVSVNADEGTPYYQCSVALVQESDYRKFAVDTPFVLHLFAHTYHFVVDSKSLNRTIDNDGHLQVEMTLEGLSPVVRYAEPRALPITKTWEAPILLSAFVEELVGSVTWTGVDDWIPGYRLSAENAIPLELVRSTLESIGSVLQSQPDGSLLVRPLWPVSVPNLAFTDDHAVNDDRLFSMSEAPENNDWRNRFRLLDQEVTHQDTLEFVVDDDNALAGWLYAYPSPWRDGLTFRHTRGEPVYLLPEGDEYYEPTINSEGNVEYELLEFSEGKATTRYPIVAFIEFIWLADHLGGVTFVPYTNEVTATVNDYSLAQVRYRTRRLKARTGSREYTSAQYLLEEAI